MPPGSPVFLGRDWPGESYDPALGYVFISVNDHDKNGIVIPAKTFQKLGFTIMSTRGTAAFLAGLSGRGVESPPF